jgi:HAD superfamily hydrolase (TIGR01549 family)
MPLGSRRNGRAPRRQRYRRSVRALRAVIFDVDFTLAKPGPDLGPDGYRRLGRLHGLDLDPARYDEARRAAVDTLERHPELDHDEEIWILFTQRIIEGMGGAGSDTYAAAVEMTRAWEHAHHFELYDDALAALDVARRHSLKIGLLSNTARDLAAFATHHRLRVDALLTSRTHGKIKPHAAIFERMLELLDVKAEEALMVGDTLTDDVEGARAVGIRAVLVDREDRYPEIDNRVDSLWNFERLLRG